MYQIIVRPLLFLFDAEAIHHVVFALLRMLKAIPGGPALLKWLRGPVASSGCQLWGLHFPGRVGLAAGFDKDARLVDVWADLGFSFVEIGTLTPQPQPGNEKPRLFRLPQDRALINRMGFNNEGVAAAIARLRTRKSRIIVGGNIGKNKSTPNEEAVRDYLFCLEQLYPWVDYFVVNVSSPNTPGLRALQDREPLTQLLQALKSWVEKQSVQKPLLLKIAPDLTPGQLDDIVEVLRIARMDGVVATNTTLDRSDLQTPVAQLAAIGAGGLSGQPLAARSTEIIRYLRGAMGPSFPIIGVGGVMTVADALEKRKAGADLVQLYTGFVYGGPGFVGQLEKAIG